MKLKFEFAMKVKKGLGLHSDEAKEYRKKIRKLKENQED